MEFGSADNAIPASPKAPNRASGTIRKNGMAVIIVLLQSEPSAAALPNGQPVFDDDICACRTCVTIK